jgi:hypothetical protein
MAERIRILSIDGGGIRGITPAMVIKALLGDVKAQDAFHIIAGTSTGGIIACGLAKPDPVSIQKIVDLCRSRTRDLQETGKFPALVVSTEIPADCFGAVSTSENDPKRTLAGRSTILHLNAHQTRSSAVV